MRLQIGQPASPTFDRPIDLLSDCHRRVEFFLGVLDRLGRSAGEAPLDEPAREALATALRYFREAAPKHTADEEESLFPRLRRSADPRAAELLARMDRLEAEHRQAAPDHDLVDNAGRDWLAHGTLAEERRGPFRQATARLLDLYSRHIGLEDNEVFPLASEILAPGDLLAVGTEMARRRGVSPPTASR